mmetsp:Transcript_15487/g.37444  ORF Transcript_15487/g.37444 Transcript_15487/m.37444 type:complete len:226 (-) Transcript_15487:226-903(-)
MDPSPTKRAAASMRAPRGSRSALMATSSRQLWSCATSRTRASRPIVNTTPSTRVSPAPSTNSGAGSSSTARLTHFISLAATGTPAACLSTAAAHTTWLPTSRAHGVHVASSAPNRSARATASFIPTGTGPTENPTCVVLASWRSSPSKRSRTSLPVYVVSEHGCASAVMSVGSPPGGGRVKRAEHPRADGSTDPNTRRIGTYVFPAKVACERVYAGEVGLEDAGS